MTNPLEHPLVADETSWPQAGAAPAGSASKEIHLAPVCEALRSAFQPGTIKWQHAMALAKVAVRYHILSGAPIFRREARCDALWLLGRGRACVGIRDTQRRWLQCRSVHAGQWLDVASAWLGDSFLETAIAETGVVIAYEFPVSDVQQLCRKSPAIAELLMSVLANRVRSSTESAHDLVARDVPGRVAKWLLANAGRTGNDALELVMDRRKRALAAELNTSPETLSRALGRLRHLGLIAVDGYRIDILDPHALRTFSGWGPRGESAEPAA